jgi:hypothetical protein
VNKNAWMIWLAPAAVWGIYMCWLAGYRSGFEQGHTQAWDSAQDALVSISAPLPHHYQSVALGANAPATASP